MQVNRVDGISAYTPHTKPAPGRQIRRIHSPGFGWGKNLMPTYTPTDRSDEEIKNAIIELAIKDARNGIYSADPDVTPTHSGPSAQYQQLIGEYVQSVSPDRRTIYSAALAQIGKAVKIEGAKPVIDTALMDLMLSSFRAGIKNPGIQYNETTRTIEIDHFAITANGEDIGRYSSTYGWSCSLTKAELSRKHASHQLYVDTWRTERAKTQTQAQTTPEYPPLTKIF